MAYTQVTTTNSILGELIAQLRSAKGMNQTNFAKSIDLSPSAWSRVERGETGLTQDQLKVVCEQLNVTRGQLFDMVETIEMELAQKRITIKKGAINNLIDMTVHNEEVKSPPESSASISSTALTLASIVAGASIGKVVPIVGPTLAGLIGVALQAYLKRNR